MKCIYSFNGKSERKKPLGLPRRRWEDNTKIGLGGVVCEVVYWSHQSLAGFFKCGNESQGIIKGGEFID